MNNEIALFSVKGEFVIPSDEVLAGADWSPARMEAFEVLRAAAIADMEVAAALAEAQQAQSDAFRNWIAVRAEAAKAPRPSPIETARAAMGREGRK